MYYPADTWYNLYNYTTIDASSNGFLYLHSQTDYSFIVQVTRF